MSDTQKEKLEILIVDDVKENLIALRALLSRNDLNIVVAMSGQEALELMMKHDFALAMLDIHMPMMNGFELAELMRGINKTKNIPIVFVSAADKDQKYTFKGYEIAPVDFLRKPLAPLPAKSKVNVYLEFHQQKMEIEVQAKLIDELKNSNEELEETIRSLTMKK
ncbi:MAG: response regulator [Bacteriovorax sp.]|nr:response regulator [Bacteriovorax sp.]